MVSFDPMNIVFLFFAVIGLAFLIFCCLSIMKWYKISIVNAEGASEKTIHTMLANLEVSFDRGEISRDEYRVIKLELQSRLQEILKK